MTTPGNESDLGSPDADADAARGAIHDIFILYSGVADFMLPARHQLAVAGPKGSGKTLLLFNKNIAMQDRATGTLVRPDLAPHAFRPLAEFSQLVRSQGALKGQLTREAWASLWEWALARSLLAIWLNYAERDTNGTELGDCARRITVHLDQTSLPRVRFEDPYETLTAFLTAATSGAHSKRGNLIPPSATDSMHLIVSIANKFPPTFMYIDNQDDFFRDAPSQWVSCGWGTLNAVKQLRARTGNRVHCCVAIRSEVYWEILGSDDGVKSQADILLLEWDNASLRRIFERRVSRLAPEALKDPGAPHSLKAFFGTVDDTSPSNSEPAIQTEVAGRTQEALSYLLRFTLGRPRDAIALGNAIIRMRSSAPAEGGAKYSRALRDTIAREAGVIAKSYAAEVKHRWPWSDQYPLEKFLIRYISWDLLRGDDLTEIRRRFADELRRPVNSVHPFCALAALGLLGWPKGGRDSLTIHFPRLTDPPLEALPGDIDWVVMHPALQHQFEIKPNRFVLVGHGEPFDATLARQFMASRNV